MKNLILTFILGTETAGAKIQNCFVTINSYSSSLNIWKPLSSGMLLRVADLVPILNLFTT